LIGSGFSKPAGYPTTEELNIWLKKIDESEIGIDGSGRAGFLDGQKDPNASRIRPEERHLVQEFLEFYRSKILEGSDSFHYEKFYDYYVQLLRKRQWPNELVRFFHEFRTRHAGVTADDFNLLWQFHLTFSQLIADRLNKGHEHAYGANSDDQKYEKFLSLVENLGKDNRVHFHSLNHDLWMEHLATSESIRRKMDDGFEELGSPFYGELNVGRESYMVRLSRFTNEFAAPFRLYKLHGSIDRYLFHGDIQPDLVKLRRGISPVDLYKEVQTDGVYGYAGDPTNYYTDFLTGTEYKNEAYKEGTYYPRILQHFETNLVNSSALVVIGYGFKDPGINEYIETYFLPDESKRVFIVGDKRPEWKPLDLKRVHFDDKGVTGMDIDYILKNANTG
jgi:hypothetical protein